MSARQSRFLQWFCGASISLIGIATEARANPTPPALTPLQERIDALRQEHGIPGASIAVIDEGKIAWARGFGMADQASGRPVTADTLFQTQSITKTLTALATVKPITSQKLVTVGPASRCNTGANKRHLLHKFLMTNKNIH